MQTAIIYLGQDSAYSDLPMVELNYIRDFSAHVVERGRGEGLNCPGPMKLDRLYHSNALLLPDGRVLVAGSNPPGEFELGIEIFHPPYLFIGPRPKIRKAPNTVSFGKGFEIQTPDSEEGNIPHPSPLHHPLRRHGRAVRRAERDKTWPGQPYC